MKLVEVRFKPSDVGSVADGAITNIKINAGAAIDMSKLSLAITDSEIDAGAAIAKSKLGALASVDADVSAIGVDKVTGAVDGRAASTSGDKDITAIGWDDATAEVIVDHEA